MDNSIYLRYGYLMFPVNLKVIQEIEINNKLFYCKKSFHISLMRLCDLSESRQEEVFRFAKLFVKQNPIKLENITYDFRLVTEGELQSIIVRVKMMGLKQLISAINKEFGLNIVYPPTHITLYALKDQFGISIDTPKRYHLLTRKVDPQIAASLLKTLHF